MNVCKWCMSGSATENSILLSVLPRLNKNIQSVNQSTIVEPCKICFNLKTSGITGMNILSQNKMEIFYHETKWKSGKQHILTWTNTMQQNVP